MVEEAPVKVVRFIASLVGDSVGKFFKSARLVLFSFVLEIGCRDFRRERNF